MKLNNSSKGSGIPMVFFAISIAALLAGAAAYAQVYKLPPAFGETVDEMGVITEAETRLDDTVEHFIPLAAHYGVSQAAYEIGSNNTNYTGHADPGTSGPTEGDDDVDEMRVYRPMIDTVDYRSQSLYENYADQLSYDRCDVVTDDQATVNLSYESAFVNVSADNSNPLARVECMGEQVELESETERGKEISFNITNLRYHELASLTVKALKELEGVSETLESNDRHYGTTTGSVASCVYDAGSYSDPGEEAEEAAFQNTMQQVSGDMEDFEDALVERSHGYGGSNRGAKEKLYQETTSGLTCFFGVCPANFWIDNIDYNVYVEDNETSTTSISNSTFQCGCNNYACNQDNDGEYSYVGGSCKHSDETNTITGFSNPYTADCDPGEHKDGGDCYNASSSPRHVEGSPTCDEEDFSHDGSGGCEIDEEHSISDISDGRPNPQCTNKVYNANTEVSWEYEQAEIQVNLTDSKFTVPTSEGWINLFMNKKYIRNYAPP